MAIRYIAIQSSATNLFGSAIPANNVVTTPNNNVKVTYDPFQAISDIIVDGPRLLRVDATSPVSTGEPVSDVYDFYNSYEILDELDASTIIDDQARQAAIDCLPEWTDAITAYHSSTATTVPSNKQRHDIEGPSSDLVDWLNGTETLTRQQAWQEAVAKHEKLCWLDRETGSVGWRGWKAVTATVWATFIPDYYLQPAGNQTNFSTYRTRLWSAVWSSCLAQEGDYDVRNTATWEAYRTTINNAIYAAKPAWDPA